MQNILYLPFVLFFHQSSVKKEKWLWDAVDRPLALVSRTSLSLFKEHKLHLLLSITPTTNLTDILFYYFLSFFLPKTVGETEMQTKKTRKLEIRDDDTWECALVWVESCPFRLTFAFFQPFSHCTYARSKVVTKDTLIIVWRSIN